ncbi:uncharacterized protein LACBIDRAFT_329299 [Laccaria bicolor S238N-H82]|uniref:Predicted protein n=1 Tax=Laccaria bicolor (strain S238N-H82 / ATCC MYA-4686) TaxID=486041 RepID=B0DHL2_LACBS|nr:uncharacterized protein LACBIDRAFT_329299 [Laccaria bicolor S238N-H82]EDR05855.1 predicted protein [Laccaria bicolor S238N-H82]|eukprot:XP_001883531.1 predicted protein [Laccaria bicolor S238N-H82]
MLKHMGAAYHDIDPQPMWAGRILPAVKLTRPKLDTDRRTGKCASPYRGKVDELESGRVKAPVKRWSRIDWERHSNSPANKITEITSIPHIEATAYFAQLNIASAHGPQFIGRWRVPCLGITVIGDQVTFYAIILLGHQYRLISLTPTLSCLRSASDLTDRTSLYRAFAAASVLDMRIFEDRSDSLLQICRL